MNRFTIVKIVIEKKGPVEAFDEKKMRSEWFAAFKKLDELFAASDISAESWTVGNSYSLYFGKDLSFSKAVEIKKIVSKGFKVVGFNYVVHEDDDEDDRASLTITVM